MSRIKIRITSRSKQAVSAPAPDLDPDRLHCWSSPLVAPPTTRASVGVRGDGCLAGQALGGKAIGVGALLGVGIETLETPVTKGRSNYQPDYGHQPFAPCWGKQLKRQSDRETDQLQPNHQDNDFPAPHPGVKETGARRVGGRG